MVISVESIDRGILNQMDIDVTREQLERWCALGEPPLVAMSNLSADEVQFLLRGMTAREWVVRFGRLAR